MTTTSEPKSAGPRAGPLLACLVAAALFGASSPAAKALLSSTTPLALAGLLYLGAALGTLPFALRGGSRETRLRPTNLLRMGGVVLFGGVLGPCLLLLGLARAPAASVSLWLNLETVATAVLGWAFFKEHLDRRAVAAVVLVTAGSAALAGATGWSLVTGALLVAAACACWGLDNNLQSIVDGFTPAQSTCIKGVVAGSVNLALAFAIERPVLVARDVVLGLVLGALAYGASIVLYVRGAQQLGATRAQMVFATAPFVGVVVAWAWLRERATTTATTTTATKSPSAEGTSTSTRTERARTSTRTRPTCIIAIRIEGLVAESPIDSRTLDPVRIR